MNRRKINARLSKHTYTSNSNFWQKPESSFWYIARYSREQLYRSLRGCSDEENHSTLISRLNRVWAEIFLLIFAPFKVKEMQILRKFLCCLTIETGGLIIGYLNLIGSILLLVSSVFWLVQWPDSSEWWSIYFVFTELIAFSLSKFSHCCTCGWALCTFMHPTKWSKQRKAWVVCFHMIFSK